MYQSESPTAVPMTTMCSRTARGKVIHRFLSAFFLLDSISEASNITVSPVSRPARSQTLEGVRLGLLQTLLLVHLLADLEALLLPLVGLRGVLGLLGRVALQLA